MNIPASAMVRSPLEEVSAKQRGAADAVLLTDCSLAPRYGCKGAGAEKWLAEQGLPVPARPNSWQTLPGGGLIARPGRSEFLVEDNAEIVTRLAAAALPGDVAAVLRQDAVIALSGPRLPELLLQVCNVNFAALDPVSAPVPAPVSAPVLALSPVVLTTMAGVGVTAIPEAEKARCRLWCDGSYGVYLWETLCGIVSEMSKGAGR